MTVLERRPALRWLVPLVAGLVLVLGGSGLGAIAAHAGGALPHRSAAQLLVDVQKARPTGLSGTVVQTSDLGLPSLPSTGGGQGADSANFASLLSGSHTMRVWYAGPNQMRLALLSQLGESDVVRNGTDLWTWSSTTQSATHRTVPKTDRQPSLPTGTTPQAVAEQVLKAITPTTEVTTADSVTVAGRPAYELVLRPRDSRSLIGSVQLALDGKTHVPTRVQIFAKGHDTPAFEVGFTAFDPTTPPASVFTFNPPPGTKVTEGSKGTGKSDESKMTHGPSDPATHSGSGSTSGKGSEPQVVGKGWTTVVVGKSPVGVDAVSGSLGTVLKGLPKAQGAWGSGRVLTGTLFSAVLTDDGRIAVGAVPPSMLYSALSSSPSSAPAS